MHQANNVLSRQWWEVKRVIILLFTNDPLIKKVFIAKNTARSSSGAVIQHWRPDFDFTEKRTI